MTRARFLVYFGGGETPSITEDVLDSIEEFLVLEPEKTVTDYLGVIISYTDTYFPKYIDDSFSFDGNSSRYREKFISIFRCIKPTHVTAELSTKLEGYAFKCLEKTDNSRILAYNFLIEHFQNSNHGVPSRIPELLQFVNMFFKQCLMNLTQMDCRMLLAIIESYHHMLNICEQRNVPSLAQPLLTIVNKLLEYQSAPSFFPDYYRVCQKAIRGTSRLYEQLKKDINVASQPIMELAVQVLEKVPNDIRFVRLQICIQQFMCVISQDADQRIILMIHEKIKPHLYAVNMPPFNHSVRIIKLLFYYSRIFPSIMRANIQNTIEIIPILWSLISTVNVALDLTNRINNFFIIFLNDEAAKAGPFFLPDVADQLIISLEILLKDNQLNDSSIENWASLNFLLIKMLRHIFNIITPSDEFLYLSLERLVKHENYILRLLGEKYGPEAHGVNKEVKKRCIESSKLIFEIYGKLSTSVAAAFWRANISRMLPHDENDIYVQYMHPHAQKVMNGWGPYLIALFEYYEANIRVMHKLNGEIFFKLALIIFLQQDAVKLTPEEFALLGNKLFYIILQVIKGGDEFMVNTCLIPFLARVTQTLQTPHPGPPAGSVITPAQRLQSFQEALNKHSEMFPHFLLNQPNDVLMSRLGFVFFQFFASATGKYSMWFSLFLPALERDKADISLMLRMLYGSFVPRVVMEFDKLAKDTKQRFIGGLSRILIKGTPKEADFARALLKKMPDTVISLALEVPRAASKKTEVVVSGNRLQLEPLFEAVRKDEQVSDSTVQFLVDCLRALCEQYSLTFVVGNEVFGEIIEFVASKKKDALLGITEGMEEKAMRAAIYISERALENSKELIGLVKDKVGFATELSSVVFYRDCVPTILRLMNNLLDGIEVDSHFSSIVISVIQNGIIDHKSVEKILNERVFNRVYNESELQFVFELAFQLSMYCVPQKPAKLVSIALRGLRLLDKQPPIHAKLMEKLGPFISKFENALERQGFIFRYSFIFTWPFSIVPTDHWSFFQSLLKSLDQSKPIRELQPMEDILKTFIYNDPLIITYTTMRIKVKVLAWVCTTEEAEKFGATMWLRTIERMRMQGYSDLIPYFIKKVDKFCQKLGGTTRFLTAEYAVQEKQDFSVNELKLYAFLAEHGALSDQNRASIVMQKYLLTLKDIIAKNPGRITDYVNIVGAVYDVMSRLNNVGDSIGMVLSAIEFAADVGDQIHMIQVPLENVLTEWQTVAVKAFSEAFRKRWRKSLFAVCIRMFKHPKMSLFQQELLNYISENIAHVIERVPVENQTKSMAIAQGLTALAETIMENHPSVHTILHAMNITKTICGGVFRPSHFNAAAMVLFPIELEAEIKQYPTLQSAIYMNIDFILSRPRLFNHSLLVKRVAKMSDIIPIYTYLDSHLAPTVEGRVLWAHLRCEILKQSPPQSPIFVSGNFGILGSSDSSLVDAALRYQLSIQDTIENVTVNDFDKCGLIEMSSRIQAAALLRGDVDTTSITTFTRLVAIGEALTEFDKEKDYKYLNLSSLVDPLSEKWPENISAVHNGLKSAGSNINVFDPNDRSYVLAVLRFCILNVYQSRSQTPDYLVYFMPKILKSIIDTPNHFAHSNAYDLLIYTTTFAIKKMKYSIAAGIPSLDKIKNSIQLDRINRAYLTEVRPIFSMKAPQDQLNYLLQLVLQLVPAISNTIFIGGPFFPQIMCASNLFSIHKNKSALPIYQKALAAIVLNGGRSIAKKAVDDMYANLRIITNTECSKPLASPFATVALWIDEFKNDPLLFSDMCVILDAMKPATDNDMIHEIQCLKQPLHPFVLEKIMQLLEESFPLIKIRCMTHPKYLIFVAQQSQELALKCWENDWSVQVPETHIHLFAKFLLSASSARLAVRLETPDLRDLLVIALNDRLPTMPDRIQLERFINYYCSIHQGTSLAAVFHGTRQFKHRPPMPREPLYKNMFYMEQLNIGDDGLGMLKSIPDLYQPASFMQLYQYEAAFGEFINKAEDHNEYYSLILPQLREAAINMKLPSTEDLIGDISPKMQDTSKQQVNLPFLSYFWPKKEGQFPTTSFFSSAFIPIMARAVIFDEAATSMTMITNAASRGANMPLEEQKLWTLIWIRALDPTGAMASSLTWRMTALRDAVGKNNNDKMLKDALSIEYSSYAELLSRGNSLRRALRLIKKTGSIADKNIMKITKQSVPRMVNFFANLHQQTHARTRLMMFITLCDVEKASQFFLSLVQTQQNRLQQFQQQSMAMQLTPQQIQKQQQNLMEKNFRERARFGVQLFLMVMTHFSSEVKPEQLAMVFSDYVQYCSPMDVNALIASVFKIAKENQELATRIINMVSVKKDNERLVSVWLKWFPHLITNLTRAPVDFIKSMIIARPVHLRGLILHLNYSMRRDGQSHGCLAEVFPVIQQMRDSGQQQHYDQFVMWLRSQEAALHEFDRNASIHELMYRAVSGDDSVFTDSVCQVIGGNTKEAIIKYCLEHPPFLKLEKKELEISTGGGKRFPLNDNQTIVFSAHIEAAGETNATMNLITLRGEQIPLSIVSARNFKFDYHEEIFVSSLLQYMEAQPATRTQCPLISYPGAWMVFYNVYLVRGGAFATMYDLVGYRKIVERLATMDFGNRSPKSIRDAKMSNLPRTDGLFNFFLQGADGNLENFVYMRHAFAMNTGSMFALRWIFFSGMHHTPSILISQSRVQAVIPSFMPRSEEPPVIPLTPSIRAFLPDFCLRGGFSTSWLVTAQTISDNSDAISLILDALTDTPANRRRVIMRAGKAGFMMTEDTTKNDTHFPFKIVDHLIETAESSYSIRASALGWV